MYLLVGRVPGLSFGQRHDNRRQTETGEPPQGPGRRMEAPGATLPSLGEEGAENPRDLHRGVLHHEVAGPHYQLKL